MNPIMSARIARTKAESTWRSVDRDNSATMEQRTIARKAYEQAKERICLLPDFPRPIRLPGGGRGAVAKRWHPAEVMEWAERHRDKRRAA